MGVCGPGCVRVCAGVCVRGCVQVGGALLGGVVGVFSLWLIHRIHFDIVAEITVTLFACYGAFLLAEGTQLHVSGVLAVVALGLVMSSSARTAVSEHHSMHHFWEMLEYFANTIIFILAGVIIYEKGVHSSHVTAGDWGLLLLLYAALHVVRGLTVLVLLPALKRLGYGLAGKEACVLVYAGLRGAVGLVLALILANNPCVESVTRDLFSFHMAGIAALTLLINGTTTKALVTYLGLAKPSSASQIMFRNAVNHITLRTQETLARLQRDEFYGDADWAVVDGFLPDLCERVDDAIKKLDHDGAVPGSRILRGATLLVRAATGLQGRGRTPRRATSSGSADSSAPIAASQTFATTAQATGTPGAKGTTLTSPGMGSLGAKQVEEVEDSDDDDGGSYTGFGSGSLALLAMHGSRTLEIGPNGVVRGTSSAAGGAAGGGRGAEGSRSRRRVVPVQSFSVNTANLANHARFSVKRVATLADAKEAFRAEARHRLLNLVKSAYWKHFSEGMVSRNAVSQLLTAASLSQDRPHLPLHEWKFVDEELRRSRSTVSCVRSSTLMRGAVGRRVLFSPLAYEFDVATTFIVAHRDVETVFQELVENDSVSGVVLAESRAQVARARAVVDDIVQHFPEVTRAIKTQQVVHTLLMETNRLAHELLHHGEIEEKEYGTITACVTQAFKNARVPTSVGLPSSTALLSDCGLLEDLSAAQVKTLLASTTETVHAKGHVLVKQGEQVGGFYVIVRGAVRLMRRRGVGAGNLEVGEEAARRRSSSSLEGLNAASPSQVAGARQRSGSSESKTHTAPGAVEPAWSRAVDDPTRIRVADGDTGDVEEVVVERLHRGAVVGLLSLLTGTPQLTTAVCDSSVDVFFFDESKVFKLLRSRKAADALHRTVAPLERNLCRMAGVIAAEAFLPRFRHFPFSQLRHVVEHASLLRPPMHVPLRLGSHAILLCGSLLHRTGPEGDEAVAAAEAAAPVLTAEDLAREGVRKEDDGQGESKRSADSFDGWTGIAGSRGAAYSSGDMLGRSPSPAAEESPFDPGYTAATALAARDAADAHSPAGDFVVLHHAFHYMPRDPEQLRYFGAGARVLLLPARFEQTLSDVDARHTGTVQLHKRLSAVFRLGSTFGALAGANGSTAVESAAWAPALDTMAELGGSVTEVTEEGDDGDGDGDAGSVHQVDAKLGSGQLALGGS